jgi:hypothetical protein
MLATPGVEIISSDFYSLCFQYMWVYAMVTNNSGPNVYEELLLMPPGPNMMVLYCPHVRVAHVEDTVANETTSLAIRKLDHQIICSETNDKILL